MKKYKTIILSSIPVGYGGAGDYLSEIVKAYPNRLLIAPRGSNLFNAKIIKQCFNLIGSKIVQLLARLIVFFNPEVHVVLYHPQSLGYKTASIVINRAKEIDYWVVDASFFCKKSYNVLDGKECTRCLSNFNPDPHCVHFPKRFENDHDYKKFLCSVEKNLQNIKFFVQTESYKSLILEKFISPSVWVRKMITPSLYGIERVKEDFFDFDFGFHGNLLEAKGYNYVLALAEKLPSRRYFIPGRFLGDPKNKPNNCIFSEVTWNSGLPENLRGSRIILCPSIWSAPVEASVIKSLLIGRPVGLVASQYSFSKHIETGSYIPLSGVVEHDSIMLNDLLNGSNRLDRIAENGFIWASHYIDV